MKNFTFYILFFIFYFLSLFSQAQQIQWASKVIKFSSDLGGENKMGLKES